MPSDKDLCPIVIQDTREQTPWTITKFPVVVETLPVGDYGIKGFSDWTNPRFVVERKSLDDLVGSLTQGRERFIKEIEKMAQFRFAGIIVESVQDAIPMHHYRSQATPQSIEASIDNIIVGAGVHFHWGVDAAGAALKFEDWVRQFARRILKDWKRITKGMVE